VLFKISLLLQNLFIAYFIRYMYILYYIVNIYNRKKKMKFVISNNTIITLPKSNIDHFDQHITF